MLFRCAYALLLFALLGACSEDKPEPSADAGPTNWSLALTHESQLTGDLGESLMLQVFYSNSESGGLEGENIHFEIAGAPQGASLSANDLRTDAQGFAAVTIQLPLVATVQPIQVAISAAKVDPLIVQIDARQPQLLLVPIGPTERELRTELLVPTQIMVKRAGGGPVEGVSVRFAIRTDGNPLAAGQGIDALGASVAQAVTGASGIARVNVLTGEVEGDLRVSAEVEGVGTINFIYHITERGGGEAGCRLDSDCGEGFICERQGQGEDAVYACIPEAASGCDPNDPVSAQCPLGYICDVTGECIPGGAVGCIQAGCEGGQVCIGNVCVDPCSDNDDCPNGQECVDDICQEPTAPPDLVLIEGFWNTRYQMDLSEVLGPLGDLGAPIDFLDQAFRGNLEIPIPLIGDIIEDAVADLIAAHVPPWVGDLVHGLNSIVHIFQGMQVAGQMEARHRANPLHVRATEVWDRAIVQLIDRCPLGRQDPNYPACAEVDILLDQDLGDIGRIETDVPPFVGRLYLDRDQEWNVRFDREVHMDLVGLVRYVVNLVVSISTNGRFNNVPDALEAAIDCQSIQRAADQAACDLSGGRICNVPGVDQMCRQAAQQAGLMIDQQLGELGLAWTAMEFDQTSRVFDDDNNLLGDELGRWPAPPGTLDGDFRLVVNRPLEGVWHGVRP